MTLQIAQEAAARAAVEELRNQIKDSGSELDRAILATIEKTPAPPPQERAKIALITYASPGYKDLADLTLPNKTRWASQHGYFLMVPDVCDCRWDRVRLVYQVLNMGYAAAAWLDCDWLCTNLDVSMEDLFDTAARAHGFMPHLLFAWDINGVNTGAFFARNTPETMTFLCAVLGHGFRRFAEVDPAGEMTGEQEALEHYALLPLYSRVAAVTEQRLFNSFRYRDSVRGLPAPQAGEWAPSHFGLHLAGVPMEDGHDDALALSYPGKLTIAREVLGLVDPTGAQ